MTQEDTQSHDQKLNMEPIREAQRKKKREKGKEKKRRPKTPWSNYTESNRIIRSNCAYIRNKMEERHRIDQPISQIHDWAR